MTPQEEELLRAAGNCYNACREGFDETVRMISEARGLDPVYVEEPTYESQVKVQGGSNIS